MSDEVMSVSDHLNELRLRLRNALLAVIVGVLIAYAFSDLLFVWLAQPLIRAWAEANLGPPQLHFSSPIEPFFTYLKVAMIGGIFLATPVVFYQLWMFVAPGLYRTERRYVIPFTVISVVMFAGGAAFGYFVVFPYGFRFFLGFAQKNMGHMQQVFGDKLSFTVGKTFELRPTLMMGEYFGLVWRLLLAFGLVFELPLLITFLAMAGLVTHKKLWAWNPYFIVIAFIVAAVLTPPDVITQVMMAVPLVLLYNLSVVIAWYFSRRREKSATLPPPPA